jgi:hypothetical protein
MAIGITVITTANSARRFLQTDEAAIEQTLDSLRRSSQMFAGKPLIVGSEAQTEVFARASIACLEFAAAKDLSALRGESAQPAAHRADTRATRGAI